MAQSNKQLPPQAPQNEIADAVRNVGAILIYFLAFLASVAIFTVISIDRELWAVMLAFMLVVWLVAFSLARILNSNK